MASRPPRQTRFALAQVRDRRGRSVTITSGTAELGTGRPMVSGTGRFRIAGVTKPFTAVAVLRLVADQIRPAGLRDTYWPPTGGIGIRGPHARTYELDPANPAGSAGRRHGIRTVSGRRGRRHGVHTSDLNRFWRELFGGRLLPPRMLAEMKAAVPAPELGPSLAYGLGLIQIPLSCGGHAWGHAGDLPGVSNVSARDGSGRVATVYMTAQTGPQGANRLRLTIDVALCATGRDGLDLAS